MHKSVIFFISDTLKRPENILHNYIKTLSIWDLEKYFVSVYKKAAPTVLCEL